MRQKPLFESVLERRSSLPGRLFTHVLEHLIMIKWPDAKNIRLYTQDDTVIGLAWGIQWEADTRRFFYFYDYMGWHNLSETHRRDQCDDPAYCLWHGSL